METNLTGTLAIDLGNTNTVVAFQDQNDVNFVLVEIPNITSSPGVIPTAVWFEDNSKILSQLLSLLEALTKISSVILSYLISTKTLLILWHKSSKISALLKTGTIIESFILVVIFV